MVLSDASQKILQIQRLKKVPWAWMLHPTATMGTTTKTIPALVPQSHPHTQPVIHTESDKAPWTRSPGHRRKNEK